MVFEETRRMYEHTYLSEKGSGFGELGGTPPPRIFIPPGSTEAHVLTPRYVQLRLFS